MAYLRKYNISEANTLTKPLNLQDITITPSKETQTYIHDESLAYNGLGVVTVEGVNASIDENIKPENIVEGVSILGVMGTNSGSAGVKKIVERNFTRLTAGDLTGVDYIGQYAFYNCSNLTSIELPESVKIIKPYAFQKTGITYLDIPHQVSLEGNALTELPQLETLVLRCPIINDSVVKNCTKLKDIKLYNTERISAYFADDQTPYNTNISKNGHYLGNDENPYLVFLRPEGYGCEIREGSLIAEMAINSNIYKKIAIPQNIRSIKYPIISSSTSSDLITYCEADSKPEDWASNWIASNRTVVWGAKKKNYSVDVNGEVQNMNCILLSEEPSLQEGEYFWDYYKTADFTDDSNIVKLPYYAEGTPEKLYARIEAYIKPDGSSLEKAFRFSGAKEITFSINLVSGVSYFIFTPSETATYKIEFREIGAGSLDTGMGVFSSSDEKTFTRLYDDDDSSSYGGNEPMVQFSATAGTNYYIKFCHYSARQSWAQIPSTKPQSGNKFILYCTKQ